MNVRLLLIVVVVCTVGGCASFGPLGTEAFEPMLRRDVPTIEGDLVYQSPATLLFGVDGYKLFSNLAVQSPIFAQGSFVSGEGIVVLTKQKLYFVKWFREKYEKVWDLEYKKITSLEVRSFGLGRRLVMMLDGAPGVTSLDVAADGGQRIDEQRTLRTCQLLSEMSGKECKLPQVTGK